MAAEDSKGGDMAAQLVNCPDCGREVSKMALACPACGRPLSGDDYYEEHFPVQPWNLSVYDQRGGRYGFRYATIVITSLGFWGCGRNLSDRRARILC